MKAMCATVFSGINNTVQHEENLSLRLPFLVGGDRTCLVRELGWIA